MSGLDVSTTISGLRALIADETLPQTIRDRAAKLEHRLSTPLNVALIGPPGSGKSTLLNYVAGGRVVPPGLALPTLRASHSVRPQAQCTLTDGTVLKMPNLDMADIAGRRPAFVDVRMDLPALRRITLLELVASEDPADLKRALAWAAKRCDVAIWCSQRFAPSEQAVWHTAPDQLRDHGFLALTKADTLSAAQIEMISERAVDRFAAVLPVATFDAIAAKTASGQVNREALAKSGGLALIRALLKEIENGLTSANDSALMLISRHHRDAPPPRKAPTVALPDPKAIGARATNAEAAKPGAGAALAKAVPEPAPLPAPAPEPKSEPAQPAMSTSAPPPDRAPTPHWLASLWPGSTAPIPVPPLTTEPTLSKPVSPEPASPEPVTPGPVLSEPVAPKIAPPKPVVPPTPATLEPAAPPQAQARPAETTGETTGETTDETSAAAPQSITEEDTDTVQSAARKPRPRKPRTIEKLEDGRDLLIAQSDSLLAMNAQDRIASAKVLQVCAEATQELLELFADMVSEPEIEAAHTTILEAADLIQLMQIEGDPQASLDAVTILLQLKRDFESRMRMSVAHPDATAETAAAL